jgi:hypothetical protein
MRHVACLLAAACLALLSAAADEPVTFVVSTEVKRAQAVSGPPQWEVIALVRFLGFDAAAMTEWRGRNALYLQLASRTELYTAAEVPSASSPNSTTYSFLTSAGNYVLTVTELYLRRPAGNSDDHRVVTEVALNVGDGSAERQRHRASLPPCLDPARSLSVDWFRGHWDTRGEDPAYVPDECSLDQWSSEELREVTASPAVPQRWVLVLGSSKDRGVYSRLIDLVMRHSEKELFHHSVVQKCWGWLDVKFPRLRLSFADFRSQFYYTKGVTCHDEKVASSPQLHLDGVKLWKRVFVEGGAQQPDVIWLVGDHIPQFPLSNFGEYLEQATRAGWKGTLLYANTNVMPNSWPNWLACAHNISACAEGLKEEARVLQTYHSRTVLVQMAPVLYSSVTDMEKHLDANCYSCSNHYHYICDRHDRRICGRSVNTAAQIVYGVLYGPKAAALQLARSGASAEISMAALVEADAKEHAQVCFDCPKDLVPIHITYKPNLACYSTPLVMVKGAVGPSFPFPLCPCMNESVVKTFTSHGGSVIDVRECDMAGSAARSLDA